MLKRLSFVSAVLAIGLVLPASVGAASGGHREGAWTLPDGNTATLSRLAVSPVTGSGASALGLVAPASQGYWNSGCYLAITNVLGNVIYSYTIWQMFGSNGSVINYLPVPTHSSTSDLGWSLTSADDIHWWINSTHKDAAARGSWTFSQYLSGGTFRNASGWVQVQDNYKGTWSCYSS